MNVNDEIPVLIGAGTNSPSVNEGAHGGMEARFQNDLVL